MGLTQVWNWIKKEFITILVLSVSSVLLLLSTIGTITTYYFYNFTFWWISFIMTFILFLIVGGALKYEGDHDFEKAFIWGRKAALIESLFFLGGVLYIILSGHFRKEEINPQQEWIHYASFYNVDSLNKEAFISSKKKDTIQENYSVDLDSILNLTPMQFAYFYYTNHFKKPILNQFFIDSIVPIYRELDYYQLFDIKSVLQNTPVENVVDSLLLPKRDKLLSQIKNEIQANRNLQVSLLADTLSSILTYEIETLISREVTEILNEYSGGFLNIHKFHFLLGKGTSYSEKLWYNHFRKNRILNTYIIRKHLNIYMKQLIECRTKYYREWFPSYTCYYQINTNHLFYLYPIKESTLQLITEYTENQSLLIARDLSIELLTGFTGFFIGFGTMAWDIVANWNENTPEERLCYILVQDALLELKNEIHRQSELLKKRLYEEDQKLYKKIQREI